MGAIVEVLKLTGIGSNLFSTSKQENSDIETSDEETSEQQTSTGGKKTQSKKTQSKKKTAKTEGGFMYKFLFNGGSIYNNNKKYCIFLILILIFIVFRYCYY